MKSKDIKIDTTYVGKNGNRRTVTHIIWIKGDYYLGVFDHEKQESWVGVRIGDFARWAQKEVKEK